MEYMSFIISIQGWADQPSVKELENLLSNQEALAKQMTNKGEEKEAVLFSKGKTCGKSTTENKNSQKDSNAKKESSIIPIKCSWCGKIGHI